MALIPLPVEEIQALLCSLLCFGVCAYRHAVLGPEVQKQQGSAAQHSSTDMQTRCQTRSVNVAMLQWKCPIRPGDGLLQAHGRNAVLEATSCCSGNGQPATHCHPWCRAAWRARRVSSHEYPVCTRCRIRRVGHCNSVTVPGSRDVSALQYCTTACRAQPPPVMHAAYVTLPVVHRRPGPAHMVQHPDRHVADPQVRTEPDVILQHRGSNSGVVFHA